MTQTTTLDPYPSRMDEPRLIPRREPTVWGDRSRPARGPLSAEQVQQFDRDGFIALPGLLAEAEVARYRDELDRVAADPNRSDDPRFVLEARNDAIRSVFEIHRSNEVFRSLAQDPRIADAARQILAGDVYIHQSRVNVKPPMVGKGFFWHSDFETWHAEDGMPQMRCLSASIALTENTEFNGPLMVVPGSQRTFVACAGATPEDNYQQSLQMQEAGTPDLASLKALVDAGGIVAPKGPAGSVVLFECNVMHSSTENLSPYPRSNAFFVYNSLENRLVEPFAAPAPRPPYIATREFTPLDRLG
jgi:ectoine hydroxylase